MTGKLMVIGAGVMCGLGVATEIFAYRAHLDVLLGAPWWRHHFVAFYAPWAIVGWAWQWVGIAPHAFHIPTMAGALTAFLITVRTWPQRAVTTKVQAHWADTHELEAAQLIAQEGAGIVMGKAGRKIVRYAGPAHLLVVAGTQSGKTVSIVRPTLFEWPGSLIVNDPKGGLYQWLLPDGTTWRNSAGYRASLGKVVLLAPLQEDTDCFNLFDMVRVGTDDAYRDVQLISLYLSNPEGKVTHDEASQHFKDLVNIFMPGVFLYGLESGLATTGGAFNELVNGADWDDLLVVMRNAENPLVRQAAIIASRPGENERGSLQTTMARCLSLFNDPRIARMTSRSTFTLHDLREAEQPCTVYLSVPFNEQERLRVFVVLVLRILLDHCTSRLTGWKHKMVFLGEEFPSLGRCDFLSEGLDHAAEFGLQYCLITPSMKRLVKVYGREHNFFDGCRVKAVFGLSDSQVAKDFSDHLGTREEKRHRVTTQKGGRTSWSEDVREEPLLNTTGLLKLGERDILVMAGRYQRVLLQARYYEQKIWNRRSQLPLPDRGGTHV